MSADQNPALSERQIEDRLGEAKSHLYTIQNALIAAGEQGTELAEHVENALSDIGRAQDAVEER